MTDIYLAPAKVNLHLAITDVRDDGYHVLDTSFVYVDVYDHIKIRPADELVVECSDASISGEQNLVYKLLAAFRRQYHVQAGLHVHVDKVIPSQAGLGGGSSDAATALMVANRLWRVGCTKDELIQFSAPFGADIPCFIFARASYATGIGENLKPYKAEIPAQYIVLAWPGYGVSTVAAFNHFDQNKIKALTGEITAATVRARSGDGCFKLGYNDLEESAITLCEPLAAMLLFMRKESEWAWMSGSGSACVAICSSSEKAHVLAAKLQEKALAKWVHIGHFVREHPLKNIGA